MIVVSQSGETADTLAALRLAKEKGITTMAIVNVVGSSIAREADKVLYTLAGPEISVATTKAYSAQLAAMYCLAVQFAKVREVLRHLVSAIRKGRVLSKGGTRGKNQCGSRAAAEIPSSKKTANRADREAFVGGGPALFWSAVQNLFRLTLYL